MRVYRMKGSLYPLNGININTKINTTISKNSTTRTVNDRSHTFQKLTVKIICHVRVVFQIQRNGYIWKFGACTLMWPYTLDTTPMV
jgi:hypothetical protein